MEQIKILAIAPYEGMKNMIENITQTRDDITLTAYVGDLQQGVDILLGLDETSFDVIISRGGTAQMLKAVATIPVLEVPLSHYDILSVIKLAQNYAGKFAIVGFPSISGFARMLCEILQYQIEIFTISSKSDAVQCVDQLKKDGYSLVLSDMVATTYAKSIGLNAMLITSNSDSISQALNRAVELCRYYSELKRQNSFYYAALHAGKQSLVVYSTDGTLLFSSDAKNDTQIYSFIKKLLPVVLRNNNRQLVKQISNKNLMVTGEKILIQEETYVLFRLTESKRIAKINSFHIQQKNKEDIAHQFFNLFYRGSVHAKLNQKVTQYSKSNFPLLIIGEKGTGKEKMGTLVYSRSPYQDTPCYLIDCSSMTDKTWQFLLGNVDSPCMDVNNTLYFMEIGLLDKLRLQELYAFIERTRLDKNNRLMFSFTENIENTKEDPSCIYLKNEIGCLTLNLPPLRHRVSDIPSLASLYLNDINAQNATQIVGFEPEAMSLLQGFSWKYNLDQFKRVLNELVTVASTPYISTDNVREVLKNEKRQPEYDAVFWKNIDLSGTLDEITFEIINIILSQEDMNQTKAAKRLGISRTTLWRILNR